VRLALSLSGVHHDVAASPVRRPMFAGRSGPTTAGCFTSFAMNCCTPSRPDLPVERDNGQIRAA